LRELGQPPTTVKGQPACWQTVERVQQYRERRVITDPGRPLGPEPAGRDLERNRHYRATRQPLDRLQQRKRAFALGFAPQTRPGWAQGPGQDGQSSLGRLHSRAENARTREFERLREARSQR
jgi:hypothetical protein